MRMLLLSVLMGGLLVCSTVGVTGPRYSILEGFWLGNECEPIGLLVEPVGQAETRMGLTQQRIITTVRSRLRAARLYQERIGPYLYVNIQVVGSAFSVRLAFNKPLSDSVSGEKNLAVTWDRQSLGQADDGDYVIARLSRLTDMFIDNYLRVNKQACYTNR